MTYTEHRPDGWPLCPCCGEDELWAHPTHDVALTPLALADAIENIAGCYACGWAPPCAPHAPDQSGEHQRAWSDAT